MAPTLPGDDGGGDKGPEDWHGIVVPDDASDLSELTHEVQRELARERREAMWEHRMPFILLFVAIFITISSLLLVVIVGRSVEKPDHPKPTPSQSSTVAASPSETG